MILTDKKYSELRKELRGLLRDFRDYIPNLGGVVTEVRKKELEREELKGRGLEDNLSQEEQGLKEWQELSEVFRRWDNYSKYKKTKEIYRDIRMIRRSGRHCCGFTILPYGSGCKIILAKYHVRWNKK